MSKRFVLLVLLTMSAAAVPVLADPAIVSVRQATPPIAQTAPDTDNKSLKVPLNDTGIADVRLVNPRRPLSVWRDSNKDWTLEDEQRSPDNYYPVEFVNRTDDRIFKITVPVTLNAYAKKPDETFVFPGTNPRSQINVGDDAVKAAEAYYGLTLSGCELKSSLAEKEGDIDVPNDELESQQKRSDAEENNRLQREQQDERARLKRVINCTIILTIYPSKVTEAILPARLFADFTFPQIIAFKARLLHDNKKLTHNEGHLRTDPDVKDGKFNKFDSPEDATAVGPAASLGLVSEPRFNDYDTGDSVISVANPFIGHRKSHFPGSARLDLSHSFTNRALAELSFGYNSADFGNQEETGAVSADEYKLSVFALNLITLNFGKYDFAAPADGLAISESGQGFTLSYPTSRGNLIGSYIVKRERDFKKPVRSTDADASSIIVQVNDIAFPPGFFRSANLTGVVGTDDSLGDPHTYRSFGIETFFARPMATDKVLGGSLALFRSSRTRGEGKELDKDKNLVDAKPVNRGSGTSGLLKVTLNSRIEDKPEKKKAIVHQTFGGTIAFGPSDDPSTANVNEGYLGENSAFGPGLLFFGKLSKPLITGLGERQGEFGSGLSNKIYYGLEYRNNDHSLLELFANALSIDPSDIISKSSTFAVRHFRFRDSPYDTKNIGTEYSAAFDIETPESVTVSVKVGYFDTASALQPVVQKNPWYFAASVKIEP